MRYIQHYEVMNLCVNNRDMTVVPFGDIAVTDSVPIVDGWSSEIVAASVASARVSGPHWLRKLVPKLSPNEIGDYLREEAFWT